MPHVIDPAMRIDIDEGACAFVMMAKAPSVGAVKTRLTPLLSAEEAANLSRCFIADMAASIGGLSDGLGHVGIVAFTPAGSEAAFADLLPGHFHLLAQRGADLGERLLHVAEDLFAVGFGAVCLINSDSPTLPPSILRDAAAHLRPAGDRLVLGGATDGGYYLIGLKNARAYLFHRIDWSTPRVFAQTMERSGEIGLDVVHLPQWYDVDDGDSLRQLYQELFGAGHAPSDRAPRTSGFLRSLAVENKAVAGHIAQALPKLHVI